MNKCFCGRYSVGGTYEPIGTGEHFIVYAIEVKEKGTRSDVIADAGFLIHYCYDVEYTRLKQ